MEYIVSTFYRFVVVEDCFDLRSKLKKSCSDHKIKGTVLIAHEGINATLVGLRESIDKLYIDLESIEGLNGLHFQESLCSAEPFHKLKVKVKPEIVTFKCPDLDMSQTGEYLKPEEWNAVIKKENAIVIDTRNDYEVSHGTFAHSINPRIKNFSDLPKWINDNLKPEDIDKPIAMFCTGGIRCEKSTAYLKGLGYTNVYHLKGGILQYLKEIDNKENLWDGKCFIFDDRVLLDNNLKAIAID